MAHTEINLSGAVISSSNIFSDHGTIIVPQPQLQVDWLGLRSDIKQLQELVETAPEYIRSPMKTFSQEAETATNQLDWEQFKVAAKKIGSIGLKYLRDLSIAVLADFVSKALG